MWPGLRPLAFTGACLGHGLADLTSKTEALTFLREGGAPDLLGRVQEGKTELACIPFTLGRHRSSFVLSPMGLPVFLEYSFLLA